MNRQILIVEDDKYISLALKIRLQAEGLDTTIIDNIADAVSAIEQKVPDIALIDYHLPDGKGLDLIGRLAESEHWATVPSIVMSASKQEGLHEQALAAGASAYFEKPFRSADLISCLQSLLVDLPRAA